MASTTLKLSKIITEICFASNLNFAKICIFRKKKERNEIAFTRKELFV